MKRITVYLLGIFLLTNFSCERENIQKINITQPKEKKNIIVINRTDSIRMDANLKNSLTKNKSFIKLIEGFNEKTYSYEQLIDLTKKNINLFRQIRTQSFNSKIDTAAVKSRLILAEINTKKLDYLLHQKNIDYDTVYNTFHTIIRNLNSVIQQMNNYISSEDEFKEILMLDSLSQKYRDSLIQKNTTQTKIPKRIKRLKEIKLNLKKSSEN